MAKITPTIEAIGISAQPGPESRSSAGIFGAARGAATTPACTTSIAASDGMNGSATAPRLRSAVQAFLKRVQLRAKFLRQLVAESRVVLLDLRQLSEPAL